MQQRRLNDYSKKIDEKIRLQEETKELKAFFDGMDELFALIKEKIQYLEENSELSVKEVQTEKKHAQKTINRLFINFIRNYEKEAFQKAQNYPTIEGRRRSYYAAYDEIQGYNSYLATEIEEYIDESWRDL